MCNTYFNGRERIFRSDRAQIVIEENRRKYTGCNNSRKIFEHFKVDGALITQGIRCDDLLIDCRDSVAYFLEFKGCDIRHAVAQISRSITVLEPDLSNCSMNARIILSKVSAPALYDSDFIRLKKRLAAMKGTALLKTRELTENI